MQHKQAIQLVILLLLATTLACGLGGGEPEKPSVTITTPTDNSSATVGEELMVQSVSVDEEGLARIELWVDGSLVRADAVPNEVGTYTAEQPWTPTTPGSHIIEVRVFNTGDAQSDPAQVTLNVTEETQAEAETEEASAETEAEAGETPQSSAADQLGSDAGQPTFTASTDLNVRSGPGTIYDPPIGILRANESAEIVGRNQAGTWWQIVYPGGPDGKGWISGADEYGSASNAGGVPVAQAPPPPTATSAPPTATATATATSPPPSPTPTPTQHGGGHTPQPTKTPTQPSPGEHNADLPTPTSPPTAQEAPLDGDSLTNPAKSVNFSPTGTRDFTHSSDVSAPNGDIEDWVEFITVASESDTSSVWVSLSCSGSDSSRQWLRAQLWEDGEEQTGQNVMCGDGDKRFTLDLNQNIKYQFRVRFISDAEPYYVQYSLKVVGAR